MNTLELVFFIVLSLISLALLISPKALLNIFRGVRKFNKYTRDNKKNIVHAKISSVMIIEGQTVLELLQKKVRNNEVLFLSKDPNEFELFYTVGEFFSIVEFYNKQRLGALILEIKKYSFVFFIFSIIGLIKVIVPTNGILIGDWKTVISIFFSILSIGQITSFFSVMVKIFIEVSHINSLFKN